MRIQPNPTFLRFGNTPPQKTLDEKLADLAQKYGKSLDHVKQEFAKIEKRLLLVTAPITEADKLKQLENSLKPQQP